jgi:hypothetical protein
LLLAISNVHNFNFKLGRSIGNGESNDNSQKDELDQEDVEIEQRGISVAHDQLRILPADFSLEGFRWNVGSEKD